MPTWNPSTSPGVQLATDTSVFYAGSQSLKVTTNVNAAGSGAVSNQIKTVRAGMPVIATAYLRSDGTAQAAIVVQAYGSAGTLLGQQSSPSVTGTSFTRVSTGEFTLPAGTAYVQLALVDQLASTATRSFWADQVEMRSPTWWVPSGWVPAPDATKPPSQLGPVAFAGTACLLPAGCSIMSSVGSSLAPVTAYSLSLWTNGDLNGTGSTLRVGIYRKSAGVLISYQDITLPSSGGWQPVTVTLTSGLPRVDDSDFLYLACTAGQAAVDHLQITVARPAVELGVVRFSEPFDPEHVDGVSSAVLVGQGDGQAITAITQLRAFCYILKQNSLWVCFDDGVSDPSQWFLSVIDQASGCAAPRLLVNTSSFFAFASAYGFFLYVGGRPIKLSQEIQPTWDAINWSAGWTGHALWDPLHSVFYTFLPDQSSSMPTRTLLLDVSEGIGTPEDPQGRKWGYDIWPQQLGGSVLYLAPDGTRQIMLAGNKVYTHTGLTDDGVPIDAIYDTAYVKAGDRGQDLFLGVELYVQGSGTLYPRLKGTDDVVIAAAQPVSLMQSPGQVSTLYFNLEAERAKIEVESTDASSGWTLRGITVFARPWADARLQ